MHPFLVPSSNAIRRHAVPYWLPDETLFSLSSRFHVVAGHALARSSALTLFGHKTQGTLHDLPSRLSHFALSTEGRLGCPEDIACSRTVLGYYLPLRSPDCVQGVLNAIDGSDTGSLKFRLGLLTSRFRAHHPLKACPACMRLDRSRFGVAYWHLEHQYPGVWLCPQHDIPLMESRLKSTGVGRFQWLLPGDSTWRTPASLDSEISPPTRTRPLLQLARNAVALAQLPPSLLHSINGLQRTYRDGLDQAGLSRNGRLQHDKLSAALLDFCRHLRVVEELRALPRTDHQAQSLLHGLLRPGRTLSHPLWHLAFIGFLFGELGNFLSSLDAFREEDPPREESPKAAAPSSRKKPHPAKARALVLLTQSGQSCRAVAKELQVDVGTVMAWAAEAGVTMTRRPKVLQEVVRQRLVRELRKGQDKARAAAAHKVSIETITRVLRTEPGLQAQWHAVRHALAQSAARKTWTTAMRKHPDLGTKALRALAPAAYAWLYRNDREWLTTQAARPPRHAGSNHAKTDWGGRDQELSRLILTAVAELEPPLSLPRLCQHIPSLKPKLGCLARLPLTRSALHAALSDSTNSLVATTR